MTLCTVPLRFDIPIRIVQSAARSVAAGPTIMSSVYGLRRLDIIQPANSPHAEKGTKNGNTQSASAMRNCTGPNPMKLSDIVSAAYSEPVTPANAILRISFSGMLSSVPAAAGAAGYEHYFELLNDGIQPQ